MRNIEKFVKKFFKHYGVSETPVSVNDAITVSGLMNKEKNLHEFIQYVLSTGDFIFDNETFIPRACFLKNRAFRIQLHPVEIKQQILISGHRFLPFCHSSKRVDELKLLYNDKEIPRKSVPFHAQDIMVFFTLLNIYDLPVDDLEKFHAGEEVLFNAYDMSDIFAESEIKNGDTLVITPINIPEGTFSVHVESSEEVEKNREAIEEATVLFTEILIDVVFESGPGLDTELQLLLSWYYFQESKSSAVPHALTRILAESEDIEFTRKRDGIVVFHMSGDDVNEFPSPEKLYEHGALLDPDMDSIDGILMWLGSSHNETIVTALVIQQLPLGIYDYESIENYLFENSPAHEHYLEVKGKFSSLVKELYDECVKEFGSTAPPLPVQSLRKKLLDMNRDVIQFLRKLDSMNLLPDDLPREELMQINDISRTGDQILHLLEDPSQFDDINEIKALDDTLVEMSSVLKNLFSDVFNLVNRENIPAKKKKRKSSNNFDTVLQIKISLKNISPPIWRRIEVPGNFTFSELHETLQEAMGWYDCHLHSFEVCAKGSKKALTTIGIPHEDDWEEVLDERSVDIIDFLENSEVNVNYIYDFGDWWEHKITLEKTLPREKEIAYPRCIKGKRACPPEDCGGPWGYVEMLKIISDKKHPEHGEMVEWAGDDFDPEYFNKDEIF